MGFLSGLPCLFPVLLHVKFGEWHQYRVAWARLMMMPGLTTKMGDRRHRNSVVCLQGLKPPPPLDLGLCWCPFDLWRPVTSLHTSGHINAPTPILKETYLQLGSSSFLGWLFANKVLCKTWCLSDWYMYGGHHGPHWVTLRI